MLNWQVGSVKITCVVEMLFSFPHDPEGFFLRDATPEALKASPWLYPHFVNEDGSLNVSAHALLVEAPGLRLVVDTCIGNDKPRNLVGGNPLATPFLQHLADAGWSRDSVDAVVCTHLHVDHVGWNTMLMHGKWVPTFPKARYLIGKREFEYWSNEGDEEQRAIMGDSVRPIFDAGLAELVEMDHRVSPEICLRPTPGHTPGHVSVVIESEGQRGDHRRHCSPSLPDGAPRLGHEPRQRRPGRGDHPREDVRRMGRPADPGHRHSLCRADSWTCEARRGGVPVRGLAAGRPRR
ncbi:MBL fold metallo-hydrolase [Paraburkholderia sp. FT54]|uniref:MBL fold metallo-hydrolase n=1 Tax=Paraburkholderia sp. FT54 TaxID=3074437 RepID=UPI002877EBBC|nr:MBL fold metallo-hydrolase [Paraburkholderia sp. FT54]WNC94637.1 MBL fold metallo-hydrolase [Paraburkholderia sp. FT54]